MGIAPGLIPGPQRAYQSGRGLPTRGGWRLDVADEAHASGLAARARDVLERRGQMLTDGSPRAVLRLSLDEHASQNQEGYRLVVDETGAHIRAPEKAGLFYGLCTLDQWLRRSEGRGKDGRIDHVEIIDHPDLARRGVMLDISRDKVPTMKTLFELIERLASWKINHLELYTEHTFAYEGHETVWYDASPVTADEIRELDRFCRERHVELVANQNTFGHFHRWLKHAPYRPLAECPEGIAHPWSPDPEPFSLCPLDPGSLRLVEDLLDQLLPCFSSTLVNVGLDETFDLGRGRSRDQCERRGREEVYLDYLREVHRRVRERGHRMCFWGDIIVHRPDLVERLPEDAIALEWGYTAGHLFDEHCAVFAESGLEFWVAPGTSSWNSFAGRLDNAVANVGEAAVAAHRHGAAGLLVTDWGDNGHLQPLSACYPGFAAAAAFAWKADLVSTTGAPRIARLVDDHCFDGRGAGLRLAEYANAYRHAGRTFSNSSSLFNFVVRPDADVSRKGLASCSEGELESLVERLGDAKRSHRTAATEEQLIADRELDWMHDALILGARLAQARIASSATGSLGDLDGATRTRFARGLGRLIEGHEEIWRLRNRPGGLADSRSRLERTLAVLRA